MRSRPAGRASHRAPWIGPGRLLALALLPFASLLASPAAASVAGPALCREVAARAGLDLRGRSGRTAAPTERAAQMQRLLGNGVAVGDADGDHDLDVYLLGQAGRGSRYFRNESTRRSIRFAEATEAVGLVRDGFDRVAHFADLDGDERLDLVVIADRDEAGALPASGLYRNRGDGTFEAVPPAVSGLDPVGMFVGGASLADFDGDGRLDIYVSYWVMELGRPGPIGDPRGELPGENRLYRNLGDFRFEDVTRAAGLSGMTRDTFSSIFADLDGDADPDIYLAVDHRPDLLWINDDGRFVDVSDAAGVDHVGNDMGVAAADLAGDGRADLYVTNISDPAGLFGTAPGGSTLLEGSRGPGGIPRFSDRAASLGVADAAWGWGTAFLDIDLDGDLDLVAAQGMDELVEGRSLALRRARSRLFVAREDGSYERADGLGCDLPGDQRALVVFDVDRDGDEDILMTQVDRPVRLLRNRAKGTSLSVIPGPGSAGVGAWVHVRVGERVVGRPILAGGSYLTGPPAEAVFGLAGARRADEVVIRWPGGAVTAFQDVPAGTLRAEAP